MCSRLIVFVFSLYMNTQIWAFDAEDTHKDLFWKNANDKEKCEPFQIFEVECNRCVCSAEGVPYCTKMACIKPMMLKQRFRPLNRRRQFNKHAVFKRMTNLDFDNSDSKNIEKF